jgi:hypothetical protein
MKTKSTAYKVLVFFFFIYIIASLQFFVKEISDLSKLAAKTYTEKLDYLDKQYYKDYFQRYYVWLNDILPKDMSFSIYHNEKISLKVYSRYTHKLNYYFYPRHVLFNGVEKEVADNDSHFPMNNKLNYSEVVLVLKNRDIPLLSNGRLKYIMLNGKQYYYVAEKEDKGLLIERSFIKKNVVNNNEWNALQDAFKELYGAKMDTVTF